MVKKSAGPRFCVWECAEAVGTQSVMNYDSSHGWCNYDLKATDQLIHTSKHKHHKRLSTHHTTMLEILEILQFKNNDL